MNKSSRVLHVCKKSKFAHVCSSHVFLAVVTVPKIFQQNRVGTSSTSGIVSSLSSEQLIGVFIAMGGSKRFSSPQGSRHCMITGNNFRSQKKPQQRREIGNACAKEAIKADGDGLSRHTTSCATTHAERQKHFSVTPRGFSVFPASLSLGLLFGRVLT